jgi:LCP family protein required for cell wall assembly
MKPDLDNNNAKSSLFNGVTKQNIIKGLIIASGALLLTIIVLVVSGFLLVNRKYQQFLHAAELTHSELIQIVQQKPTSIMAYKPTFLILGIDAVSNRPGHPQLTDTIILAQIKPEKSQLLLLSLPRDLWSYEYQTKINALYHYGQDRNPKNPTAFPQAVISNMTGVSLDKVLVVDLEQLGEIIDLIGGIEVNVKQGFIDTQFPKDNVDINSDNPDKLYETIEFKPGLQHMDGKTALKYIRSRHSENLATGTDLARAQRQQQVIEAIIRRLSNARMYWQDPVLAGQLLKFYQDHYAQYFPLEEAIALAEQVGINNLTKLELKSIDLPVKSQESNGVIEHPQNLKPYNNQWVYVIPDQDAFKDYVQAEFKTIQ